MENNSDGLFDSEPLSIAREEIRDRGVSFQRRFFGEEVQRDATPGDESIIDELDFGIIRSRDGLETEEKAIIGLAVSSCLQRLQSIPDLTRAALNVGLSARSVLEIFLQTSIYAGFVTAESSSRCAKTVFEEHGIEIDEDTLPVEDMATMKRHAEELYSRLLRGTPQVPETIFASKLYPSVVAYTYGICYRRPGLTERQRMIILVACMTAIGGMDDALPSAFICAMNA
ncbi:MAG: carboxymuconolactone decarboxylase family protein, partial [Pseudomonadota bacterium]